jgi:CRISPR-associated protein (TIGR02584 family)
VAGPETLVSLLGETPQVVTETLYALVVRRSPPASIGALHLVGTVRSRATARRHLLGPRGALARLRAAYPDRPWALRQPRFHLLLGGGGRPLEDIRTSRDNEAAARQILGLVRSLTRSASVLHGSLAGGRKTLGLYLMLAFGLFARPQDRLYHVLVPAEAELDPDFFFPSPGSRIRVDLAELPFLRFRELLPEARATGLDLRRLLAVVQARLDRGTAPGLRFETHGASVRPVVGSIAVRCRPSDARLWARFATLRARCRVGEVGCPCCFLEPARIPPSWAAWVDSDEPKLTADALRAAASRLRARLREAGVAESWIDQVLIRRADGPDGETRYGVPLHPAAIEVASGPVPRPEGPAA